MIERKTGKDKGVIRIVLIADGWDKGANLLEEMK